MGPHEELLSQLRAQLQQVLTEQRRRERARHLKARMQVRTTLAQGQMPSLQQVAESSDPLFPDELALSGLRFFRDSGTEVGLGYATAREAAVTLTNGATNRTARRVGEIRELYLEGWDFGTVAHPGVRIHIPQSRTERLVTPSEVFVRLKSN